MGVWYEKQPKFVKRLGAVWSQKIKAGNQARAKTFDRVADQIRMFLYAPQGFMWDEKYKERFKLAIKDKPKFPVTINKAFELTAIVGPYIYWQYADRKIEPTTPTEIIQEAFADFDPAYVEQLQTQQSQQYAKTSMGARLLERWMNWTQEAQDLIGHGRQIIDDMLICGRGVAWPEVSVAPGSDKMVTGSYRINPRELVIDPDCSDPRLESATWVARRRCDPHWVLERKWGRKKGSLKCYATTESTDAAARRTAAGQGTEYGKSHDWVVWYEIYSKCGIGFSLADSGFYGQKDRLPGDETSSSREAIEEMIDEAVGDYAYIGLIPGHDVILNLDKPILQMNEDEIAEAFKWPVETFRAQNEWPMELFDVYKDSEGPWPIPPLGPALGHLIVISILTAAYVEKAWTTRKDIIGVLDTFKNDLTKALESEESEAIVTLNDSMGKAISECIQFLQRPDVKYDILKALEWENNRFKEASGLYDFYYAQSEGIERSAEGTKAKRESSSIRPDDMSEKFAQFMSRLARKEMILAYEQLDGYDVVDVLGAGGDQLWDIFVKGMSPYEVYQGARVRVQASAMRKPDRNKELADIQAAMQQIMPFAIKHSELTTDCTPVNDLMKMWAKAMQMEFPIVFGPMNPPQPTEEQADQQNRGIEAEIAKNEADAGLKQAQAQEILQGDAGEQQKLEMDAAKAQNDIQLKREELAADMERGAAEMELEAAKTEQQMELELKKVEIQLQIEKMKAQQAAEKHGMEMELKAITGAQQVRQTEEMGQVQVETAKKVGDAKAKQANRPAAATRGK